MPAIELPYWIVSIKIEEPFDSSSVVTVMRPESFPMPPTGLMNVMFHLYPPLEPNLSHVTSTRPIPAGVLLRSMLLSLLEGLREPSILALRSRAEIS